MDVLVAEDDALVSLEEALAFIDGYDIHDQSLTETLAPVHSPPLDVYHQITPSELLTPKAVKPATTSNPKRAKPRRKSSESSSSQDENRPRSDEPEALRVHPLDCSNERELKFRHSENRRRNLKCNAEASILCGETSTASMSEKGSQKEFEELEAVVQRIFSESRSTFTTTAQAPAISCDVRIKHDAKRGKIVVEEASDILWKELTTYHDYPDKVLQYMQKFDELEHTVFVVAERMVLPTTKGCLFRDEGWMNVTQSESEPGVSVVELLVQFYMERDDRIDVSPENLSYAQNVVMGSLSNTFLRCFQAQQNALMEKAGPITAKALQKSSVIV
ncbi:unnamed protein product [Phytophthora lilii]|uniref:Unnamed protein product n=1 Tax=Phytophthora lilii TaxID=2077276 RepID=A0A9W6TPC9_9STRA|nr:unnamed protein product [Phytophthora lilii]